MEEKGHKINRSYEKAELFSHNNVAYSGHHTVDEMVIPDNYLSLNKPQKKFVARSFKSNIGQDQIKHCTYASTAVLKPDCFVSSLRPGTEAASLPYENLEQKPKTADLKGDGMHIPVGFLPGASYIDQQNIKACEQGQPLLQSFLTSPLGNTRRGLYPDWYSGSYEGQETVRNYNMSLMDEDLRMCPLSSEVIYDKPVISSYTLPESFTDENNDAFVKLEEKHSKESHAPFLALECTESSNSIAFNWFPSAVTPTAKQNGHVQNCTVASQASLGVSEDTLVQAAENVSVLDVSMKNIDVSQIPLPVSDRSHNDSQKLNKYSNISGERKYGITPDDKLSRNDNHSNHSSIDGKGDNFGVNVCANTYAGKLSSNKRDTKTVVDMSRLKAVNKEFVEKAVQNGRLKNTTGTATLDGKHREQTLVNFDGNSDMLVCYNREAESSLNNHLPHLPPLPDSPAPSPPPLPVGPPPPPHILLNKDDKNRFSDVDMVHFITYDNSIADSVIPSSMDIYGYDSNYHYDMFLNPRNHSDSRRLSKHDELACNKSVSKEDSSKKPMFVDDAEGHEKMHIEKAKLSTADLWHIWKCKQGSSIGKVELKNKTDAVLTSLSNSVAHGAAKENSIEKQNIEKNKHTEITATVKASFKYKEQDNNTEISSIMSTKEIKESLRKKSSANESLLIDISSDSGTGPFTDFCSAHTFSRFEQFKQKVNNVSKTAVDALTKTETVLPLSKEKKVSSLPFNSKSDVQARTKFPSSKSAKSLIAATKTSFRKGKSSVIKAHSGNVEYHQVGVGHKTLLKPHGEDSQRHAKLQAKLALTSLTSKGSGKAKHGTLKASDLNKTILTEQNPFNASSKLIDRGISLKPCLPKISNKGWCIDSVEESYLTRRKMAHVHPKLRHKFMKTFEKQVIFDNQAVKSLPKVSVVKKKCNVDFSASGSVKLDACKEQKYESFSKNSGSQLGSNLHNSDRKFRRVHEGIRGKANDLVVAPYVVQSIENKPFVTKQQENLKPQTTDSRKQIIRCKKGQTKEAMKSRLLMKAKTALKNTNEKCSNSYQKIFSKEVREMVNKADHRKTAFVPPVLQTDNTSNSEIPTECQYTREKSNSETDPTAQTAVEMKRWLSYRAEAMRKLKGSYKPHALAKTPSTCISVDQDVLKQKPSGSATNIYDASNTGMSGLKSVKDEMDKKPDFLKVEKTKTHAHDIKVDSPAQTRKNKSGDKLSLLEHTPVSVNPYTSYLGTSLVLTVPTDSFHSRISEGISYTSCSDLIPCSNDLLNLSQSFVKKQINGVHTITENNLSSNTQSNKHVSSPVINAKTVETLRSDSKQTPKLIINEDQICTEFPETNVTPVTSDYELASVSNKIINHVRRKYATELLQRSNVDENLTADPLPLISWLLPDTNAVSDLPNLQKSCKPLFDPCFNKILRLPIDPLYRTEFVNPVAHSDSLLCDRKDSSVSKQVIDVPFITDHLAKDTISTDTEYSTSEKYNKISSGEHNAYQGRTLVHNTGPIIPTVEECCSVTLNSVSSQNILPTCVTKVHSTDMVVSSIRNETENEKSMNEELICKTSGKMSSKDSEEPPCSSTEDSPNDKMVNSFFDYGGKQYSCTSAEFRNSCHNMDIPFSTVHDKYDTEYLKENSSADNIIRDIEDDFLSLSTERISDNMTDTAAIHKQTMISRIRQNSSHADAKTMSYSTVATNAQNSHCVKLQNEEDSNEVQEYSTNENKPVHSSRMSTFYEVEFLPHTLESQDICVFENEEMALNTRNTLPKSDNVDLLKNFEMDVVKENAAADTVGSCCFKDEGNPESSSVNVEKLKDNQIDTRADRVLILNNDEESFGMQKTHCDHEIKTDIMSAQSVTQSIADLAKFSGKMECFDFSLVRKTNSVFNNSDSAGEDSQQFETQESLHLSESMGGENNSHSPSIGTEDVQNDGHYESVLKYSLMSTENHLSGGKQSPMMHKTECINEIEVQVVKDRHPLECINDSDTDIKAINFLNDTKQKGNKSPFHLNKDNVIYTSGVFSKYQGLSDPDMDLKVSSSEEATNKPKTTKHLQFSVDTSNMHSHQLLNNCDASQTNKYNALPFYSNEDVTSTTDDLDKGVISQSYHIIKDLEVELHSPRTKFAGDVLDPHINHIMVEECSGKNEERHSDVKRPSLCIIGIENASNQFENASLVETSGFSCIHNEYIPDNKDFEITEVDPSLATKASDSICNNDITDYKELDSAEGIIDCQEFDIPEIGNVPSNYRSDSKAVDNTVTVRNISKCTGFKNDITFGPAVSNSVCTEGTNSEKENFQITESENVSVKKREFLTPGKSSGDFQMQYDLHFVEGKICTREYEQPLSLEEKILSTNEETGLHEAYFDGQIDESVHTSKGGMATHLVSTTNDKVNPVCGIYEKNEFNEYLTCKQASACISKRGKSPVLSTVESLITSELSAETSTFNETVAEGEKLSPLKVGILTDYQVDISDLQDLPADNECMLLDKKESLPSHEDSDMADMTIENWVDGIKKSGTSDQTICPFYVVKQELSDTTDLCGRIKDLGALESSTLSAVSSGILFQDSDPPTSCVCPESSKEKNFLTTVADRPDSHIALPELLDKKDNREIFMKTEESLNCCDDSGFLKSDLGCVYNEKVNLALNGQAKDLSTTNVDLDNTADRRESTFKCSGNKFKPISEHSYYISPVLSAVSDSVSVLPIREVPVKGNISSETNNREVILNTFKDEDSTDFQICSSELHDQVHADGNLTFHSEESLCTGDVCLLQVNINSPAGGIINLIFNDQSREKADVSKDELIDDIYVSPEASYNDNMTEPVNGRKIQINMDCNQSSDFLTSLSDLYDGNNKVNNELLSQTVESVCDLEDADLSKGSNEGSFGKDFDLILSDRTNSQISADTDEINDPFIENKKVVDTVKPAFVEMSCSSSVLSTTDKSRNSLSTGGTYIKTFMLSENINGRDILNQIRGSGQDIDSVKTEKGKLNDTRDSLSKDTSLSSTETSDTVLNNKSNNSVSTSKDELDEGKCIGKKNSDDILGDFSVSACIQENSGTSVLSTSSDSVSLLSESDISPEINTCFETTGDEEVNTFLSFEKCQTFETELCEQSYNRNIFKDFTEDFERHEHMDVSLRQPPDLECVKCLFIDGKDSLEKEKQIQVYETDTLQEEDFRDKFSCTSPPVPVLSPIQQHKSEPYEPDIIHIDGIKVKDLTVGLSGTSKIDKNSLDMSGIEFSCVPFAEVNKKCKSRCYSSEKNLYESAQEFLRGFDERRGRRCQKRILKGGANNLKAKQQRNTSSLVEKRKECVTDGSAVNEETSVKIPDISTSEMETSSVSLTKRPVDDDCMKETFSIKRMKSTDTGKMVFNLCHCQARVTSASAQMCSSVVSTASQTDTNLETSVLKYQKDKHVPECKSDVNPEMYDVTFKANSCEQRNQNVNKSRSKREKSDTEISSDGTEQRKATEGTQQIKVVRKHYFSIPCKAVRLKICETEYIYACSFMLMMVLRTVFKQHVNLAIPLWLQTGLCMGSYAEIS